MGSLRIPLSLERVPAFCQRWLVVEFAVFGSVLRDDFGPDSDVDVLVSFSPNATWGLGELAEMREELEQLFDREVDLVEKEALRNPFRRHAILTTRQVVYAA